MDLVDREKIKTISRFEMSWLKRFHDDGAWNKMQFLFPLFLLWTFLLHQSIYDDFSISKNHLQQLTARVLWYYWAFVLDVWANDPFSPLYWKKIIKCYQSKQQKKKKIEISVFFFDFSQTMFWWILKRHYKDALVFKEAIKKI